MSGSINSQPETDKKRKRSSSKKNKLNKSGTDPLGNQMVDPYDIGIKLEVQEEGGCNDVFSPERGREYGDDDKHSSMWKSGN